MSIFIKASDWREHLWPWLSVLSRHSFLEILFLNYLQRQEGFGPQLHHLANCATWALGLHTALLVVRALFDWLPLWLREGQTVRIAVVRVESALTVITPGILVCSILLLCSPSWRTSCQVSRFWRSLFHSQGVLSVRMWFALSGSEISFPDMFMFLFWKLFIGPFNYL